MIRTHLAEMIVKMILEMKAEGKPLTPSQERIYKKYLEAQNEGK